MKTQTNKTETESIFWNLSAEEAIARVSSNFKGLTENSAQEKLEQFGRNTMKGGSKASGFILFLLQFKSPITYC